jgi:hypothetical protein
LYSDIGRYLVMMKVHGFRAKLDEIALIGISVIGTAVAFAAMWVIGFH